MNQINYISDELYNKYPALKEPKWGCRRVPKRLTLEQAQAILDDPRTQKVIAEGYGASIQCVGNIKRGTSWKQLKRPPVCKPEAAPQQTKGFMSWLKKPTLPTLSWG